ncbi:NAD(P)-dependent oxidoreductase [Leptodesmis sichuanensis]|uniref:NAD(P)-dependent oxidoreductase n=1 Tax=Leptodesmis sichuanensis TaxID=2906798 RepID=UPI001F1EE829|nr:NAD(P)-dependent oxidoreductase [Leptodesmis sichuanensis]UIE38774.1 NAD(P)-dependent oxidoreductase [Leptodesmis sichuanensis A121]
MEIGLIGTGLMGLPMAERLLNTGFSLMAYNRTAEKLVPLQKLGVAIAPSPQQLIQTSTCIILMLTNAEAIREVVLSAACRAELAGKTVIQMGTIAPAESRALQADILAAGGDYLEAPVLGSIPEAQSGKLIVMVGATSEQFEQWQEVLSCFGPNPRLIGPVGAAAAVKLALNQLIGSLTSAFATSLGFIQRQHASVDLFMEILRESALYAPTFDKKLQRMLDRNYEHPNFPTKHLAKDMGLFLTEAQSLGLNPELVMAVQSILTKTLELGLADKDYSALFSAVSQ